MMASTLCIFAPADVYLEQAARRTDALVERGLEDLKLLVKRDARRLVFPGRLFTGDELF